MTLGAGGTLLMTVHTKEIARQFEIRNFEINQACASEFSHIIHFFKKSMDHKSVYVSPTTEIIAQFSC